MNAGIVSEICRKRHQPGATVRPQFTLVGCESDYGLPYWFTEEQLILI